MNSTNQDIKLFDRFNTQSKEDWVKESLKVLKNQDFNSLYGFSYEGIKIPPFFTPEDDIKALPIPLQAKKTWINAPEIRVKEETLANQSAKRALSQGADGICFVILKNEAPDWDTLLQGIDLKNTYLRFRFSDENFGNFDALQTLIFQGAIEYDFLAAYTQKEISLEDAWERLLNTIRSFEKEEVRTIFISSEVYHQAGAHAVQELALNLAEAVTYVEGLRQRGVSLENLSAKMGFSFAVGEDYFMEIAKFRAFRLLWAQIASAYQWTDPFCWIQARTSLRNKFEADAYNNMLRATTEAMAAVVGTCDLITVGTFDEHLQVENEFSERIARNVSTILRSEAHLDKVRDQSAGTYYIEYLTQALAEKAWKLFQEIEQQGGFLKALELGFIQNRIEETAQLRKTRFDSGEDIYVGVNKFLNPREHSENTSHETILKKSPFQLIQLRRF